MMFGLGFWEICLVALVVILFVKPEDLPVFFRKMGKFYGGATDAYHSMLMHLKNSEKQFKNVVDNTVNWEKKANKNNDAKGRETKSTKRQKGNLTTIKSKKSTQKVKKIDSKSQKNRLKKTK